MKRFSAFLDRKDRSNKDNLRLLGKVLSKSGFQVKDHLNHHGDAYLYIEKPIEHSKIIENLEFGGIRIYTRGKDIVSFRPQNKEEAEPFGAAYLLDIKGMFKDLMKESPSEKTATDLIRYIVEEVLNYFMFAAKAQEEEEEDIDGDSLGKVINNGSTSGTDYSNTMGRNSNN